VQSFTTNKNKDITHCKQQISMKKNMPV